MVQSWSVLKEMELSYTQSITANATRFKQLEADDAHLMKRFRFVLPFGFKESLNLNLNFNPTIQRNYYEKLTCILLQ